MSKITWSDKGINLSGIVPAIPSTSSYKTKKKKEKISYSSLAQNESIKAATKKV
jgi:hypothetical protein